MYCMPSSHHLSSKPWIILGTHFWILQVLILRHRESSLHQPCSKWGLSHGHDLDAPRQPPGPPKGSWGSDWKIWKSQIPNHSEPLASGLSAARCPGFIMFHRHPCDIAIEPYRCVPLCRRPWTHALDRSRKFQQQNKQRTGDPTEVLLPGLLRWWWILSRLVASTTPNAHLSCMRDPTSLPAVVPNQMRHSRCQKGWKFRRWICSTHGLQSRWWLRMPSISGSGSKHGASKLEGFFPRREKNKKAAPTSEEYPPYPIDRHDHSSPQRPIGTFSYLASFVWRPCGRLSKLSGQSCSKPKITDDHARLLVKIDIVESVLITAKKLLTWIDIHENPIPASVHDWSCLGYFDMSTGRSIWMALFSAATASRSSQWLCEEILWALFACHSDGYMICVVI